MDADAEARLVVAELDKAMSMAVARAYRRYGGRVEEDDLRSEALEAVLVFAGLIPRKHVNAGKLAEWRQLPPAVYQSYVLQALYWWLGSYARSELRRANRVATVQLEDYGADFDEVDRAAQERADRVELNAVLHHCPVLRLRCLDGLPLAAVAARLGVRVETVRKREAAETARLRERWAA